MQVKTAVVVDNVEPGALARFVPTQFKTREDLQWI